jgi:peptidoglycan hydrolase CwlO-like protein
MSFCKFLKKKLYKTLFLFLALAFVFQSVEILAQENDDELKFICELKRIDADCKILSTIGCQNLLEKCKDYYERKSSQLEGEISETQKKEKSYQNQVYILSRSITKLRNQIYQSNLIIKDIGIQIGDTKTSIEKTSLKIEDVEGHLITILRTIYEEDQTSLVEILFSEGKFSDFFGDLMSLEVLNNKSQELLEEIKNLKLYLEGQRQSLDQEKEDLERQVLIQQLQQKESKSTKETQEYLLEKVQGEKATYQEYLEEVKEVDQEIRKRIFQLAHIPESEAPTFEEAHNIAKYVEGITGVRPAFLLAVLTQESNIGKNVGQCYLSNSETGAGLIIKSGRVLSNVMKPTRDVGPFLIITEELGRDPYSTPVSCPMSYGWGGAMGPAQFIPSTWIIYRDRLKAITGKPGDPWDIRDAFLAAALYLSDYGAVRQTYDGEWRAAMIYFSGSTNPAYRFYGDSVMRITAKYAEDIKAIEGI